jgi:hypothetical protein
MASFNVGDKVRIRTDIESKTNASRLMEGKIGTIISLHGSGSSARYAKLDIFAGHLEVGGVYLFEIELVKKVSGIRKWSLGLKSGNLIVVKCNTEAIKELAEIIGDDRLEYITGPKKV